MDRVRIFSVVFVALVGVSIYALVESNRPWQPLIWVEWTAKK